MDYLPVDAIMVHRHHCEDLETENHRMGQLCKAGASRGCYNFPYLSQGTFGYLENDVFGVGTAASISSKRPRIILNPIEETTSNMP